MANPVHISIVAPASPVDDIRQEQKAVDFMIGHWRGQLAQVLPDKPDLILTPECCDRFSWADPSRTMPYYVARGHQVRDMFRETARRHRCYIGYAAVHQLDDGAWRNSIQLIDRDGEIAGMYHKNHPTIGEMEYGILAGREATVIETEFGRVGGLICFDLNFDELLRQYAKLKPDLLLFSSVYHGGLMQAYWAYQCRSHLVSAVERLPSHIISPVGHVIASNTNYYSFVSARVNLDCQVAHLDYNREPNRLPALREKYGREVTVFDPGYLGSVLITSESRSRTAAQMTAEFGIELLDDFFSRSRNCRGEHLEPVEASATTA